MKTAKSRRSKSKAPSKGSKAINGGKTEGGRNQSGLREHNERRILSLIRRDGAMAKAEIAVETMLSAQAVTVIINKLEEDGLVIKGKPQRGRVGQPSRPYSFNPDGAFAFGLKVGRRSFDLTLLDFAGKVRGSLHESYAYPSVDRLLQFLSKGIDILASSIGPDLVNRIRGIGLATPYEMANWSQELGAPEKEMRQWKQFNFKKEIAKFSSLPVFLCNDDTAACAAELNFGSTEKYSDFLYFFVGTFVGGGVVLNHALTPGSRGNAGAVGSLPYPMVNADGTMRYCQLINHASIYNLEDILLRNGQDPSILWESTEYWGNLGPALEQWIEMVAEGLSFAITCGISIIDFEAIVIDGALPATVRKEIVARTIVKFRDADLRGLSPVEIVEGTIGARAQSIGSACVTFIANFEQDSNTLFQDGILGSYPGFITSEQDDQLS